MGEESLTLKVAEALQDEVGYGRGRLDTVTRNELGLSIGDIVEIHGRRRDQLLQSFGEQEPKTKVKE